MESLDQILEVIPSHWDKEKLKQELKEFFTNMGMDYIESTKNRTKWRRDMARL